MCSSSRRRVKPHMLMALATGCALTAPLGIAIGVALHSTLDQIPFIPYDAGYVNAVASGMLLYVATKRLKAPKPSKGSWLKK